MDEAPQDLQKILFEKIKQQLPPHVSLPLELSSLLNVGVDSAYRRIRGETLLNLSELRSVCRKFELSLDQLFQVGDSSYLFAGMAMDYNNFDFIQYLQNSTQYLRYLNNLQNPILYYTNRDIPLFYHFGFPSLSLFKHHFWMRSIFQHPDYSIKQFSLTKTNDTLLQAGKALFTEYSKLPGVEIWNFDCINSTLMQIEYYRETKVFTSEEDVAAVYDDISTLLNHIQRQAEEGVKISMEGKIINPAAHYQMFRNEFLLGDNTLLGKSTTSEAAFVNHNVFNYISTSDQRFCDYTFQTMKNLMSRSTLLSGVGEKERSKFFYELRYRMEISRNKRI